MDEKVFTPVRLYLNPPADVKLHVGDVVLRPDPDDHNKTLAFTVDVNGVEQQSPVDTEVDHPFVNVLLHGLEVYKGMTMEQQRFTDRTMIDGVSAGYRFAGFVMDSILGHLGVSDEMRAELLEMTSSKETEMLEVFVEKLKEHAGQMTQRPTPDLRVVSNEDEQSPE